MNDSKLNCQCRDLMKTKKFKRSFGTLSLAALMSAVLITCIGSQLNSIQAHARTFHDPISIVGNSDFITQAAGKWDVGGTADGTVENPYVIEELIIDGGGTGTLISIMYTDLHFRIANCSLINGDVGIFFVNVANATVIDNELNNTLSLWSGEGIWLNISSQIHIQRNLISFFSRGISMYQSEDISIENNTIFDNNSGIFCWGPQDFTISGNLIRNNTHGFDLTYVSGESIFENNITENDYGIWLENSDNNKFYSNYFIDNINHVHIESSSVNFWNETYPIGGNYWDNFETMYPSVGNIYSGEYPQDDEGPDDFWDDKYEINQDNVDYYPIVPETLKEMFMIPILILSLVIVILLKGSYARAFLQ